MARPARRAARPASKLTPEQRRDTLSRVLGVWEANPKWTFGQLVERASTIVAGERVPMALITDENFDRGLDALVPLGWEVEECGARPADPVHVETLEEQLERALMPPIEPV